MASTLHPSTCKRSSTPPVIATPTPIDGDLPLDLLYEIMLRLPAQPICRFRAVCRSWRSLLCHPEFIAAAQKPGPLLAVGLKAYSSNEVHVLDMDSGQAVKNVNIATNNAILSPSGELHHLVVCLADPHKQPSLLDLASGAVRFLPKTAPPYRYNTASGIIGRATSTGEKKVLAIFTSYFSHEPQVSKIFTLGHDDNEGWRDTGSPPFRVMWYRRGVAVINHVAYFLSGYTQSVAMFDFNSEAWRPATSSIKGPANCIIGSLADLDGHLVAIHDDHHTSIELWFLADLDRSLWTKRYTIPMPRYKNLKPRQSEEYFEQPLAVLDDGILIWMRVAWPGYGPEEEVLRIYNPKTKTFREAMRVSTCSHFRVLTWNLLYSGQSSLLDIAVKNLLLGRRHHQSGAKPSFEVPKKRRRTSDLV